MGVLLTARLAGLPAAWAAPSEEDKALALRLFDQGRALLASGMVDEACGKLEESLRLDPLPGTLLNVAVCHEQQGRAASAVVDFREARALAKRDGRDDRVALADQHLQTLAAKVSSLVIVVPAEADRADLTITRDGTPVGRAAWGTRIPVDPGKHTLVAAAANKKSWTAELTMGPNGDVQTVRLVPLEDAPQAPAAAPIPPADTARPNATVLPGAPPSPAPSRESAPTHQGLSAPRTWALVFAGVSVFGAGFGTYFGVTAISKHNAPAATCTMLPCPTAVDLNNQAKTAADSADVSFAVALVGLGVGAVLWLENSSGRNDKSKVIQVTPSLAPGRAGLQVGARF